MCGVVAHKADSNKDVNLVYPKNYPSGGKNFYYDVNNQTATFEEKTLRVTRVENHPVHGDQCHSEFITPYEVVLDLSDKRNKAMILGPYGQQSITIKESMDDSLVQRRKGSLTVNIAGGKDGLKTWFLEPDKHSIELGYVRTSIMRIAAMKNLVPPEYDSSKEISKLKARPDFEYGKDYRYLYSETPLPNSVRTTPDRHITSR